MPQNNTASVVVTGVDLDTQAALERPNGLGATAKRVFDVLGALLLGVALMPVWVVAMLALLLSGLRPVLFRQQRMGRGNKPFTMFKFRTLASSPGDDPVAAESARQLFIAELNGTATPDPETGLFKVPSTEANAVGQFLRRYSVDEIPQLLNVLRGDMSLVGPRPALLWEAALFSAEQNGRHAVRPGMTGLWQVSGRNAVSTAHMLSLDLEYIEKWSFWFDLHILLRTPASVMLRKLTR